MFCPGERELGLVDHSSEYLKGWDDALAAAGQWLRSQAKQAIVQSGRTRFPKNLEREAEVYERVAGRLGELSPDDV